MPASNLVSIDFPAPFSPQSAWISPACSSKLTSRNATTPGKRLVSECAERTADIKVGRVFDPPLSRRRGGMTSDAACARSYNKRGQRPALLQLLRLMKAVRHH